uniref:DDE-1 domain-containing protein n=1 Tax=Amphimedon queenslandica TaxID=400682 RepID=A0A1X7TV60_AMPQE
MRLRRLHLSEKFSKNSIFAMDETACWFDTPSDTTIDVTVAKSVSIKTTGHEKNHFMVVLTAKADGTKMKPFVVFKGKGTRLMKELGAILGLIVKFSSNGWMNEAQTIEYLHTILGSLSFAKCLMVWDAYKCHMSEAVKFECARLKFQTSVVSGGCTQFIQAADVAWNGPFKSHLRSSYDTWLSEPYCHEYTKGGT